MNLSPKTTVALEDLLLVSAVFAVLCIGTVGLVVAVKAPKLIDHADVVLSNIDRTIIITGAAMRNVELAERKQFVQLAETQASLNGTLLALQESVRHTDKNLNEKVLPSVTMTVRSLDDSIQDFRGRSSDLMESANKNLLLLGDTQARLNQSIAALDVPALGRNVNLMAAEGVTISRNTASATAHLDGILADAHQEADKFVAPRTKWQKAKGVFAIIWRVAVFAAVRAI